MGRSVRNLGDGAGTPDFLHAQDGDAVGLVAQDERQNLVRAFPRVLYGRIRSHRFIASSGKNIQAAERTAVARIKPGMSKISATEPSPRMVAPETPSTCP